MTERFQEILTREELAAILASLGPESSAGSPPAAWQQARSGIPRSGPLARSLSRFAHEQGRELSTLYQRPISFDLLSCEAMSGGEFAGSMISQDRAVRMAIRPEGQTGAILIGRSLLFAWLTMALGGPPETSLIVPDRPYSPIEQRFLRMFAAELSNQLGRAFQDSRALHIEVQDVLEPELVAEAASSRLWIASFDVTGFEDVLRLRIALPAPWVELLDRSGDASFEGEGLLRSRLRDTPVAVRAEIGGADVALRRIAELQVGDTIPLDPVEGGSLLLRLEDHPKFRAVPGSVGSRLAVQVVEEI